MSCKISEVCDINTLNLSKNDNLKTINYLDTANLNVGTVDELQYMEADKDKIPSRAKRIVRKNDILISTVRPNQKHYGIIKSVAKNMVASTGFAVLTPKEDKVDPGYIYNFLIQAHITTYLHSIAESSTSAYPSIKPSVIGDLEVELPPLEEQKAIAHILSTLDDKIEVNNRISKVLENIAQTIFKRWFVDFEFPCLPEEYKPAAGKTTNSEELLSKMENVCTYRKVGGVPVPEDGKWFAYVLLCEDDSFYISVTDDLYYSFYKQYVGEGDEYTRNNKPVRIVHYEEFRSKEEAVIRGDELKTEENLKWLETEYEKLRAFEEGETDLEKADTELVCAGVMKESEIGVIPESSKIDKLDNLIDSIETGNRPRGGVGSLDEGIPSIGAENILGLGNYDYSKEKYISKKYFNSMKKGIVKSHDVLLYKDGAKLGRKSMFMDGFPHDICCINSHVFILRSNKRINQFYLYFWLDQSNITQDIINLNSNSAQPGINKTQVKSLNVLLPDKCITDKYEEICSSLLRKLFNNCIESRKLVLLRDTILPRLMSGEIEVCVDE